MSSREPIIWNNKGSATNPSKRSRIIQLIMLISIVEEVSLILILTTKFYPLENLELKVENQILPQIYMGQNSIQ